MSLTIRLCCWPRVQKNFPSFFRKIFFHRPCANPLDFSSSLICLCESAFPQLSCSLPRLKVAPRSAAGPGPRVPAPAGGTELGLQYAHFPLGEAWEPLHRSELWSESVRLSRHGPSAVTGLLQELMLQLQSNGRAQCRTQHRNHWNQPRHSKHLQLC